MQEFEGVKLGTSLLSSIYSLYSEYKQNKLEEKQLLYMVYLEAKMNNDLLNATEYEKVEKDDEILIQIVEMIEINFLSILVLENYDTLNSKNKKGFFNFNPKKIENELELEKSEKYSFSDACEFLYRKIAEFKKLKTLSDNESGVKNTNFKTRLKNIDKVINDLVTSEKFDEIKDKEGK